MEQNPVERLCRKLVSGIHAMLSKAAPDAKAGVRDDCVFAALEFLGRLREKALAVAQPGRCAYCMKSVRRHVWDQVLSREVDWFRRTVSLETLRTPAGDPVEFADPTVDVFERVTQGLPWIERLPEHVAQALCQKLNDREREALRLHYFVGLRDAEIAARLQLRSANAAGQVRRRALLKASACLLGGDASTRGRKVP